MKNILFLYFIIFNTCSYALTFNVDTTLDQVDINPGDGLCQTIDNHCSLRAAIMESNVSFVPNIILPDGTYQLTLNGANEDNTLTGDLDIKDDLFIIGESLENTIIDGMNLDRVFDIIPDTGAIVNLRNLTIINGDARQPLNSEGLSNSWSGGALRSDEVSTLKLNNISINNNHASFGSAIYTRGLIYAEKIQFLNNSANFSGTIQIIGNASQLIISECLFENNTSNGTAAILSTPFNSQSLSRLSLEIDKCAFINNTTLSNGGIIKNLLFSQTIIRNSTFSGNNSDVILFNDEFSTFHLINSTIVNNNSGFLLDSHASPLFITIRNSVIADNNHNIFTNFFTSEGGNYFGDSTDVDFSNSVIHNSDIISDDEPLLSPLLTFQHPWQQVHFPLFGSPLIDAGIDELCEETDQLGQMRPQDTNNDGIIHCNIGATAAALVDLVFLNGFD